MGQQHIHRCQYFSLTDCRVVQFTVSAFLWLLLSNAGQADLGDNSIGRELWQMQYAVDAPAPDSDQDGDGLTEREEAVTGTDPRRFDQLYLWDQDENTFRVPQPVKGKSYQVTTCTDLQTSAWEAVTVAVLCTDESEIVLPLPKSADAEKGFFRLVVSDVDSDQDGVSDAAEHLLEGFDPQRSQSFGRTEPDRVAAEALLKELEELTIRTFTRRGYEKTAAPARVRVERKDRSYFPLTVFLTGGPFDHPHRNSAVPTDYTLPDSVVIPAGRENVTVNIVPTLDNQPEVPERLVVTIPNGDSAMVELADAPNLPEFETLFLATFQSASDTKQSSGYSVLRLNGENAVATFDVTFSNLEGEQMPSYLSSGRVPVLNLEPGQLRDASLRIFGGRQFQRDQDMLDALRNGSFSANITSTEFPDGELFGRYKVTQGLPVFSPPAAPSVISRLEGNELERDVARFLTQATFGSTRQSHASLLRRILTEHDGDQMAGYAAWIDDQMAQPATSLADFVNAADYQEYQRFRNPESPYGYTNNSPKGRHITDMFWTLGAQGRDQLRQRMGFALSQIFVVSLNDSELNHHHRSLVSYFDTLNQGAFGNYRDLIEKVTLSPAMGTYLSHLRNRMEVIKDGEIISSPDENYARELMQLFSCGLFELHPDGTLRLDPSGRPIPTYSQKDVSELARVLTGWVFGVRNEIAKPENVFHREEPKPIANDIFTERAREQLFLWQQPWIQPMRMLETNGLPENHARFVRYHDNRAKTFLSQTNPAGLSGEDDLKRALDVVANHYSTAPFLSRRLIQRLVTANPSPGYVYRVAKAFKESGGNFGQTVKAILLDQEARDLRLSEKPTFGKKKEPVIAFLNLMRVTEATTDIPLSYLKEDSKDPLRQKGLTENQLNLLPRDSCLFRIGDTTGPLGQSPYKAPSVFNFYTPDFTLAGKVADQGLVAPEMALVNEVSWSNYINSVHKYCTDRQKDRGLFFRHHELPREKIYPVEEFPDTRYPETLKMRAALVGEKLLQQVKDPATSAPYQIDSHLWKLFMGIMDQNRDGLVTKDDTRTYNNEEKIRAACAAVVDYLDLHLCNGQLKQLDQATGKEYLNTRSVILDYLVESYRPLDRHPDPSAFVRSTQERINYAVYLVATCPRALVQR